MLILWCLWARFNDILPGQNFAVRAGACRHWRCSGWGKSSRSCAGTHACATISASQGFETVALKCKHKNNCKKHKKKNQQNNNGPGQVPDNPSQTPDNPKPKKTKTIPRAAIIPPSWCSSRSTGRAAFALAAELSSSVASCQANEVRDVIGKGIFACRQNKTTAQATPVSSTASVAAAPQARNPASRRVCAQ